MYPYCKPILFFLLFLGLKATAQNPFNVQRGLPSVVSNDARLKVQLNLSIPVVVDTTHGINGGLDSMGLIIQIRSTGLMYIRDTFPGGHKWTVIGAGVATTDSFVFSTRGRLLKTLDSMVAVNNARYVTNSGGAKFLGSGTYASKPLANTGPGFYWPTDTLKMMYTDGSSYSFITEKVGQTFDLNLSKKGQPGDTVLTIIDSTHLGQAAQRDSSSSCIHHIVNADGSWTWYSTCTATGTAGGDLTGTYPNPTIGANKVTLAKITTGTPNTLIGYDGSGNAHEIAASTGIVISGNLISSSGGGGSAGFASVRDTITCTACGFAVGDGLSRSVSSWVKWDTISNFPVGVVSKVIDANTFEVTYGGKVAWTSGKPIGTTQFASTTAGGMTATSPMISIPVGMQIATGTFLVQLPSRPVDFGGKTAQQIASDSLNYALLNAVGYIDFINSSLTNNYQDARLIGCQVLSVTVDNMVLPAQNTGLSWYSFDGSTGTLIFNVGLLSAGSNIHLIFKRLPYNYQFATYNIILDGNSIWNGFQTSDSSVSSQQAIIRHVCGEGFPFNRIHVLNRSVGNQTTDTLIVGQTAPQSKISRFIDSINAFKQPGMRNIILFGEQVNQLFYGMSIRRTEQTEVQYCDTARAHGWEVIVVTQPGRDTSTNHGFFNTPTITDDTHGLNIIQASDTVNIWRRATWQSYANGIIDLVADFPLLLNYPDSDTYYHYSADGIHYGDSLSWVTGQDLAAKTLAYIGEAAPNPYYVVDNTAAYSSYISAAGVTGADTTAFKIAFQGLSTIGAWQYINYWYPLYGGATNAYKVNAKNPGSGTLTAINPGGGSDVLTYSASTGVTFGGNARVEIPVKDSTIKVNSFFMLIYANLATGGGSSYLFGSGGLSGRFFGANFDHISYNGSTVSTPLNFPPYTGVDQVGIGRNGITRVTLMRDVTTEVNDVPKLLSGIHIGTNTPVGVYYLNATPTIFNSVNPWRAANIILASGLPAFKAQQIGDIIHNLETALGRSYNQVH